jgi:hypothetical protein
MAAPNFRHVVNAGTTHKSCRIARNPSNRDELQHVTTTIRFHYAFNFEDAEWTHSLIGQPEHTCTCPEIYTVLRTEELRCYADLRFRTLTICESRAPPSYAFTPPLVRIGQPAAAGTPPRASDIAELIAAGGAHYAGQILQLPPPGGD